MFQTVILAGGEGTRLRPLTCDLPKPMAPLCGRPAMDYILDLLGAPRRKRGLCHFGGTVPKPSPGITPTGPEPGWTFALWRRITPWVRRGA